MIQKFKTFESTEEFELWQEGFTQQPPCIYWIHSVVISSRNSEYNGCNEAINTHGILVVYSEPQAI